MSNYAPTMSREACHDLAQRVLACDTLEQCADVVETVASTLPDKDVQGTWAFTMLRYARAWRNGRANGKVFAATGNTKLPFVAFSSLAIYSCPGAGECVEYCYSLRAWRYPGGFLRQLQNTLLLRFRRDIIVNAFGKIKSGRMVRLYVDGDFASADEVGFWFGLIDSRQDLTVYGYSKSWREILAHGDNGAQYPANYVLNLSSGSRHGSEVESRIAALSITRGKFVAVKLAGHYSKSVSERFADSSYHAEVRERARTEYGVNRVFSCTGKCGTCAKSKHACGDNERFVGVVIAIGVH